MKICKGCGRDTRAKGGYCPRCTGCATPTDMQHAPIEDDYSENSGLTGKGRNRFEAFADPDDNPYWRHIHRRPFDLTGRTVRDEGVE